MSTLQQIGAYLGAKFKALESRAAALNVGGGVEIEDSWNLKGQVRTWHANGGFYHSWPEISSAIKYGLTYVYPTSSGTLTYNNYAVIDNSTYDFYNYSSNDGVVSIFLPNLADVDWALVDVVGFDDSGNIVGTCLGNYNQQ